jgi:hypothetical protein
MAVDGLERARTTKRDLKTDISVLLPQDQKNSICRDSRKDAESTMIKSLRLDKKVKWGKIVDYLNQSRRDKGQAATFTKTKIYGRFVRHTTRTAVPMGEIGFDAKDYVHLREPSRYSEDGREVEIGKVGKKRIRNYENASELKTNMRLPVGVDARADLTGGERTEQLMEAVAKVERNFWKLVADEMERATTKLYRPEDLASRYHDI